MNAVNTTVCLNHKLKPKILCNAPQNMSTSTPGQAATPISIKKTTFRKHSKDETQHHYRLTTSPKPTNKKSSSKTTPVTDDPSHPSAFSFGKLKMKLTVFPAIGGMMASDDTSLHPTVQEDKTCGHCRKSESSNDSPGTLSTSINISLDSSCSKSSRHSGSAQFNYSSDFYDNTSRTAVKGSKNSICSEDDNCGTSQKYEDFHSDSSRTSTRKECGSFTIPLLPPLETKEWNLPTKKKENDLHTKGKKAIGKTLPKRNLAEDLREDHTINAQEKNNMAYRLLSARDHKIKELKTKVALLQNKLETSTMENKTLKGLQCQHLKAIKKYENAEINLPDLWPRRFGKAAVVNTACFRHQLAVEKKKIIEAQSITENLQVEVKSLKLKLKERERELSITNIYAHRIRKGQPEKSDSCSIPKVPFPLGNLKKLTIFPAIGGMMASDDTSLHPTVQEDKSCGHCRKSESSNDSPGTLSTSINISLDSSCSKSSRHSGSAQFNYSSDFYDNTSRTAVKGSKNSICSEDDNCGTSQKYEDFHSDSSRTSTRKECGSFTIPLLPPVETKEWNLPMKKKENDLHTKGKKAIGHLEHGKTLPKKKPAQKTSAEDHTINAQEKNNMAYRLLSARDHKIKELKNEVAVLQNKLETSTMENKTLKGLQCQHLKAIKKYENAEINLPDLLATRSNEVQTLRALLRKSQEEERRASKKLRDVEAQLLKTTDSLRALQKLCEEKKLEEREQLQHKLTSLTQKWEASEKRTQDLEKQLSLNTACFRHQLAVEKKKIIEAQSITENLQVEVKSLKLKLKKLTIFPAIGGMMASDDTSLHPTVQEDKSCGHCRKSESSNYSPGTLSTSINISLDSSCSSRQSGSVQFNYSSGFQDNTSRTAVNGSKNNIFSEENNCGTSQKYYHKDFQSDSSTTSTSEECGSFTIPLLQPLETKEWNFRAEKKENDLHTKGKKAIGHLEHGGSLQRPPEDHTINAQEKNNMAYRLLSARDHKIKELKNEVAVLQTKLETSTMENKTLKGLQCQHLKAIKKYENAEINLPDLLATRSNEVQTLRALLRKSQEEERRASKKLRDVEAQLLKTTDSLRALQKLCEDKKLEEREQLQRKLASLTQKLEASEKRTQDLEKQLSLNTASFRHQLAVEKKKIIEAQSITENLQVEVKSLKLKLQERERERSITNIYAHRIRKGQPEKSDSCSIPKVPFPLGNLKKLTIFPAIGGMMASDDTSLHPTVQEDKSCGHCRKSESSNYSPGTLSTSINISLDSSCSSRQSGSVQFNYSSGFQDNTSRTAVNGSKNNIFSEENNCGTSQKYYHKDFQSDSSTTSTSEECGSFTIPLLQPLETKEWNFRADKKESDLHTKGKKAIVHINVLLSTPSVSNSSFCAMAVVDGYSLPVIQMSVILTLFNLICHLYISFNAILGKTLPKRNSCRRPPEDHTINAQEKNNMAYRLLSARDHKIKELKNEVAVLQNKLETSTMENKTLKGLQCQHLKAIKKYENAEINLPDLLATRSNEVQTLRALLRKSQEEEQGFKKLRDVEAQLLKTTDSLRALQKLCEDKKLEEREQLQRKLASLTQKLEASEKRTQDLEKQLSLNTASFRHQLAVEKKKIIEAQSITENLQVEVKSLKLKLQERERERITNIYAHRIRKGQPEKSDSAFSFGKFKVKLTIFPAIGGMMASDDTSLHPTVQEDKIYGQCRKSGSSSNSPGRLIVRIPKTNLYKKECGSFTIPLLPPLETKEWNLPTKKKENDLHTKDLEKQLSLNTACFRHQLAVEKKKIIEAQSTTENLQVEIKSLKLKLKACIDRNLRKVETGKRTRTKHNKYLCTSDNVKVSQRKVIHVQFQKGYPSTGPLVNPKITCSRRPRNRQHGEIGDFVGDSATGYEPSFARFPKERQKDTSSTPSEENSPKIPPGKKGLLLEKLFGPTAS
ncbi:hypothetical protein E2320_005082 [Naja naja]|nr:hypothetical protein E2320_005082 [Naja naja]